MALGDSPRLFVLDAMNLAYRAYHALRKQVRLPDGSVAWESLKTRAGEPSSAVFGIANTLLKIRREERPDYWVLAWDGPGPTERHARYAEYKAHRKPIPPDFVVQLPAIEDLAAGLGLPVVEMPGLEADDVMATLAARGARDGFDVILVTSDKDLLQIVDDRIKVMSPLRGEDYQWVDAGIVRQKWKVSPPQVRDVLALMGDTSDNVPGVRGIGEKTAQELILTFGSLDELYRRLPEVTRPALRRNLEEHRDEAFLSRDLVTVHTDCAIDLTWDALRVGPLRKEPLLALSQRYELVRLRRLAEEGGVPEREAGPPPLARSPERRGTVPDMSRVAAAPDPLAAWADPDTPEAANGAAGVESATESGEAPEPPPETTPYDPAQPVPSARPFASPHSAVTAPPPGLTPLPADAHPVPRRAGSGMGAAPAPAGAQAALDLWGSGEQAQVMSLEELEPRLHAVRARAIHGVALLPITSGDEARTARLLGLGLAARDGTTAYAPLAHLAGPNLGAERFRELLGPLLDDAGTPKVTMDLKRDRHVLAGVGLALEGGSFDLHIGSFLCDPEREHDLTALARDVLGVALPPLDDRGEARGRRVPIDAKAVATVGEWAERAAGTLFPIADALRAQLESREQWRLYADLEHPLIDVLWDMEQAGIRVDRAVLEAQSQRAGAEIARLEAELVALAGEPLNLNSGPQLARVMFDKLRLAPGRRTKTGYSTDQATLEELATEHPFPAKLLEYRAQTKLKSTYLDALPAVADPRDGRVHTTFNQAGAATGRLSSSGPNLQNIPTRSAVGREIRRAFVAGPGRVLVGADYSQIELRVMAHLSEDPNLIEAFARNEDVHDSTARRIFNRVGEVPPELRARAKIVNFGIMYGMGPRSLSQQMGISLAEAQEFIGHYFRVYARVRETLDRTLTEARSRGWVQTLFGRRRYVEGLHSPNGATRSFWERVAINTPIQGSAADLMKLAMTRVHASLKASVPSARLLLQVHDELLLECAAEEADAAAHVMRTEMESCVSLRVPLEVSVGRGATWLDVH